MACFRKGIDLHLANFSVTFYEKKQIETEYLFKKDMKWDDPSTMVTDVSEKLKKIVYDISYDSEANRVQMTISAPVYGFEFLNGNLI